MKKNKTRCQHCKDKRTNYCIKRDEPANDNPVQFGSQNLQKIEDQLAYQHYFGTKTKERMKRNEPTKKHKQR